MNFCLVIHSAFQAFHSVLMALHAVFSLHKMHFVMVVGREFIPFAYAGRLP
jgi:hypothetical protein